MSALDNRSEDIKFYKNFGEMLLIFVGVPVLVVYLASLIGVKISFFWAFVIVFLITMLSAQTVLEGRKKGGRK